MTIQELKDSDKAYVNAKDIAPIINADPAWIRFQAHENKDKLGFNVIITNRRVKIPRKAFLQFLGEEA